MNETNSTDSIQQSVLDKIQKGKVRPHSRTYFLLRIVATVVVSILLLLTSALAVSFILFTLHESGEQFLLGYGLRGIQLFFTLFPWLFVFLAIIFIGILEWLLQGFKFAYRLPLLYVFGAIVAVSVALGMLINLAPLHPTLLRISDENDLFVVGEAYKQIFVSHEDEGICRGQVLTIGDDTFVIRSDDHDRDTDDGTSTIRIDPESNLSLPHVGDHVFLFGESQEGCEKPEHIEILSPASR